MTVDEVTDVVVDRFDGTLTYGATRQGSNGVVIGGLLWLVSKIPSIKDIPIAEIID